MIIYLVNTLLEHKLRRSEKGKSIRTAALFLEPPVQHAIQSYRQCSSFLRRSDYGDTQPSTPCDFLYVTFHGFCVKGKTNHTFFVDTLGYEGIVS